MASKPVAKRRESADAGRKRRVVGAAKRRAKSLTVVPKPPDPATANMNVFFSAVFPLSIILYYFFVQLLILVITGVLVTVLVVLVYRLTLHPLAKYPGPFLAKITDFYSVNNAWSGTRHLDFYKLHQQYGDIVRYGPNSLSFNTNTALQTIYGFKANVQKAHFYSAFPANKNAYSTHSAIDRGVHARKRRVLSQAFSESALRGLQPHILSVVRTFCDTVGDRWMTKADKKDEWSQPKNMAQWTNYMSYDVLGDICYGQSFDTLERPDNRFAIDLVSQSSKFHYLNAQMPALKKLGLDKLLFKDLGENRSKFMAYSRGRLQQRMKLGTDNDRRDFFYYLLNAKDPETGLGFAQQELWGESNLLLIAGSDTTSTAFSATLFYLLKSPRHLSYATSLVRGTFPTIESIVAGPEMSKLKLLRACIDESMRLSPPVPGLLPREIRAGGMEIDDVKFPAGTVVGTPIYAIHRNPKYFPRPETYMPERWHVSEHDTLNHAERATAEHNVKRAQSAFSPFSIGPRGCIGKSVAYLELTVALSRLLWMYDLRLAPGQEKVGAGSDGMYELRDIFVAEKNGPIVQFKPSEQLLAS